MYKKEWLGEEGYCNCLLVVMARIPIPEINLHSNQEVPNLEKLASSRQDTLEWVKAQEFQYRNLNLKRVIETLLKSARMKNIFGVNKTGKIFVMDCVKDSGPTEKREFNLTLQKTDDVMDLTISLQLSPVNKH